MRLTRVNLPLGSSSVKPRNISSELTGEESRRDPHQDRVDALALFPRGFLSVGCNAGLSQSLGGAGSSTAFPWHTEPALPSPSLPALSPPSGLF